MEDPVVVVVELPEGGRGRVVLGSVSEFGDGVATVVVVNMEKETGSPNTAALMTDRVKILEHRYSTKMKKMKRGTHLQNPTCFVLSHSPARLYTLRGKKTRLCFAGGPIRSLGFPSIVPP
jgi:hypothetical protein